MITKLPPELLHAFFNQVDTQSLLSLRQVSLLFYSLANDVLMDRKDPAAFACQKQIVNAAVSNLDLYMLDRKLLLKFIQNLNATALDRINAFHLMAKNHGIKLTLSENLSQVFEHICDNYWVLREEAFQLLQGTISILTPSQVDQIAKKIIVDLHHCRTNVLSTVLPSLNLLIPKMRPILYQLIFPTLAALLESQNKEISEGAYQCINAIYHALNGKNPDITIDEARNQILDLSAPSYQPDTKMLLAFGCKLTQDTVSILLDDAIRNLRSGLEFRHQDGLDQLSFLLPYLRDEERISALEWAKAKFYDEDPLVQCKARNFMLLFLSNASSNEISTLFFEAFEKLERVSESRAKALLAYSPQFMQGKLFSLYKKINKFNKIYPKWKYGLELVIHGMIVSEEDERFAALQMLWAIAPRLDKEQSSLLFDFIIRNLCVYDGKTKIAAFKLMAGLMPKLNEEGIKLALNAVFNAMHDQNKKICISAIDVFSVIPQKLTPKQIDYVLGFLLEKLNSNHLVMYQPLMKVFLSLSPYIKDDRVTESLKLSMLSMNNKTSFAHRLMGLQLLKAIAHKLTREQVSNILIDVMGKLKDDFFTIAKEAENLLSYLIVLGKCTKEQLELINIKGMQRSALTQCFLDWDHQLKAQQQLVEAKEFSQACFNQLKADTRTMHEAVNNELKAYQDSIRQQCFFKQIGKSKLRHPNGFHEGQHSHRKHKRHKH